MFARQQAAARGHLAQRGGGLVLAGDVALADAGALDNPFVTGFDDALQVTVFHYALGQLRPETGTTERIMLAS
jgi:hypothetical protein